MRFLRNFLVNLYGKEGSDLKKIFKGDTIFRNCTYIILVVVFFITILPLLNLLSLSLSSPIAITKGLVTLWPVGLNFEPYKFVIGSAQFLKSFITSFIISGVGSIMGVFMCIALAYSLSKKDLPYRKMLTLLVIFTTMFNGGLIPTYMVVNKLGLLNSIWSIIFPSVLNVFNVLIAKSYFESIPEEIEESAKIDGASTLSILLKIILPISGPLIAILVLFYAVDFWNEYVSAKMYITSAAKMPLQLFLRTVIFDSGGTGFDLDANQMKYLNTNNITNAMIVSSMLPVIILYPFLQRFFIKGVTLGAVKG